MFIKKITIYLFITLVFFFIPLLIQYAIPYANAIESEKKELSLAPVSNAKSVDTVQAKSDASTMEDSKNNEDDVDKIIIFYINDVNGVVYSDKNEGRLGLAKISTLIKQERKTNKNVLFLNAGDSFFGTLLSNSSRGEMMVKIFNEMGLDGTAIGNRDFYYGYRRLDELKGIARFPFLMSNIIEQNGNRTIFQKNYLINVGGYNIGVFGLSNPYLMQNGVATSLSNLAFLDPITTAKSQVKILQQKGADIIIALTHLGVEASSPMDYRSVALSNVDGVDVVIDGHMMNPLPKGLKLNKVTINSAGQDTIYLGKLTIEIDDKNTFYTSELLDMQTIGDNVAEDKNIIKIIKAYEKYKENPFSDFNINLAVDLDADPNDVRSDATAFSILLTNALHKYSLTLSNVENKLIKFADSMDDKSASANIPIDIVMINSGFIKRSLYAGNITFENIFDSLPYENYGVVIKLKGWEIKEALEKSVSRLPEKWAGFLQVAGITFDVDPKLPIGQRISNIKFQGQDIGNNNLYNVLITDYLYKGKDEYLMFIDKPIVGKTPYINHIFMEYLKHNPLDNYEFISPIKFLN